MLRNILKISGLPSKTDTTLPKCYLRTFISSPTTINWTDRRYSYTRSCSAPWDTNNRKTSSIIGQPKDEQFMRYKSSRRSKSVVGSVKDENPHSFPTNLTINSSQQIKINYIQPDKKLSRIQSVDSIFQRRPRKMLSLVEEILEETNLGKTLPFRKISKNRIRSDPEVSKFDTIASTRSCPSLSISLSNVFPKILNKDVADETLSNVKLEKTNSFIELKRQSLATPESIIELSSLQMSSEYIFPKIFKPRAFNIKDKDFIDHYSNNFKINIKLPPQINSSEMKEINKFKDACTSCDSMLTKPESKHTVFKMHPDSNRMKTHDHQIMSSKRNSYKKEVNNNRTEKNKYSDKYALHPFANKAAARMILIDANYRSNPQKSFSISSILKSPQCLKKRDWIGKDKAKEYKPFYLPKEISFNYTREEINKMKKILDTAVARIDPSKMSFHEHFIYKMETDLALRIESLEAATKRKYTGGTKPSEKLSGLAITGKNVLVGQEYSNQLSIRKYHMLTKIQDKKLTEKTNYTDLRQLKGDMDSLDNLRKTQWRINNFYKWHKLNNIHNVQLTLKRSYSYIPQTNYFLAANNKPSERRSIRLKSTRSSTNIAAETNKIKVPLTKETFLPTEKEISSEEFYPETVNASKYINQYYDEDDRKSAYKEDYVNKDLDEEDSKSAHREDDGETWEEYPRKRQLTLKDMMNMGINDLRRKLFHLEPERYDEDSDDAKSKDYKERADDEDNKYYSKKGYKRYMKKLKRQGLIPYDFKKNFKLPEKAEYLDETMSGDEPTNEEDYYYRLKKTDGPKENTYYSRYEKKADETWNKVVNYFKAMPGVPSADEFKKRYYRKRAEKYAKLAGLVVLDKEEQPENLGSTDSQRNLVDNALVAESTDDRENDKDEPHLKPLLSNINKQHSRSYSTLSVNNNRKLLQKTFSDNGRSYSTLAQNQLEHVVIPDVSGNSFHPHPKDFFENVIKTSINFFDPEVVSQESVDSDDEKTVTEAPAEQKEPKAEQNTESAPSEDKKCCPEYNLNNIVRTIEAKERIFKSIMNLTAQYNRRFSTSMIDSSVPKKDANLPGSGATTDSNNPQTETENSDTTPDKPTNPEIESVCSIDSDNFSEKSNTKESTSPDPIVSLIPKRCYSKNNASEDLDAINKSLDEKDHQRLTENIVKSIIEATTAQCQQNSDKIGEETVVFQPRIVPRRMTLAEIIFSEPNDEYEKYFKATCLAAFLDIFRKTEMLSDANFEEAEKNKTDELVKELNKLLTEENENQEKDC